MMVFRWGNIKTIGFQSFVHSRDSHFAFLNKTDMERFGVFDFYVPFPFIKVSTRPLSIKQCFFLKLLFPPWLLVENRLPEMTLPPKHR